MRNLKRALSLALATVMLLGTMVVGSSAKGLENFSDAAAVVNKEAVAVTSHIGIFVGEDGNFMPEKVVTRAEMAVIVVKMLYGADVNIDQFADMASFTDVPAWAQGWTSLAASLGIIVGDGDGTFRPNDPVTTAEASVMLAKTLGYFKNPSVEFGNSWELTAVAKATQLGLFGGMKLTAKEGLKRDNVAEMVFNALTATVPVQYNELLGIYYTKDMGMSAALKFEYTETLGYKNFNLVYKTVDQGVYGRPEQVWGVGSYTSKNLDTNGALISESVRLLAKDEIATTAKTPTYSYTANTKEYVIHNAMNRDVLAYDWEFFIDGEEVSDFDHDDYRAPMAKEYVGDDQYAMTDKGAITEFYVTNDSDKSNGKVVVVKINNYLGEVTNVKTDDKGEIVTIRTLSHDANKLTDRTFRATGFKKGDIVNFTINHKEEGDVVIQTMKAAATITGVIESVQNDQASATSFVTLKGDSTKHYYVASKGGAFSNLAAYDVTDSARNNHPTLGDEYILYVTDEGYVMGYKVVEASDKQYLYIKAAQSDLDTYRAKVVLADGTTQTVTLKETMKLTGNSAYKYGMGDLYNAQAVDHDNNPSTANIDIGGIFKYSVDDKGIYTLSYVKFSSNYGSNLKIKNGTAYIADSTGARVTLLSEDTIFVDVKNGKSYTGYSNVPSVENAALVWGGSNFTGGNVITADIVYIVAADIYDASSLYFTVTDASFTTVLHNGDEYRKYEKAYNQNGEKFTAYVASAGTALEKGKIYKAQKTVDEHYITAYGEASAVNFGKVEASGTNSFRVNGTNFAVNKDTKVVLMDYTYDKYGAIKNIDVGTSYVSVMNDKAAQAEHGYIYYVNVMSQEDGVAKVVFIELKHEDDGIGYLGFFEDKSGLGVGVAVSNEYPELGDKVAVKITSGRFNVAGTLANDTAGIYDVVINGRTYTGYCVTRGELVVPNVVITNNMFDGFSIVLEIGTVKATGKSVMLTDAEQSAFDRADYTANIGVRDVSSSYVTTCVALELSDVSFESGYFYSVTADTLAYTHTTGEFTSVPTTVTANVVVKDSDGNEVKVDKGDIGVLKNGKYTGTYTITVNANGATEGYLYAYLNTGSASDDNSFVVNRSADDYDTFTGTFSFTITNN